ncbi:MAG: NUDIX domain-containing protein, partial [Bacilli bacterium]
MIEVVAGILIYENKLLILKRHQEDYHSLKWEFVGGKKQEGEQAYQALQREIYEELNLKCKPLPTIYFNNTYQYDKIKVNLSFYLV